MGKELTVGDLGVVLHLLAFGAYVPEMRAKYNNLLGKSIFKEDVRPCSELLKFYLLFNGNGHTSAAEYVLSEFSEESQVEFFARLSRKEQKVIYTRSEIVKKLAEDLREKIVAKKKNGMLRDRYFSTLPHRLVRAVRYVD